MGLLDNMGFHIITQEEFDDTIEKIFGKKVKESSKYIQYETIFGTIYIKKNKNVIESK